MITIHPRQRTVWTRSLRTAVVVGHKAEEVHLNDFDDGDGEDDDGDDGDGEDGDGEDDDEDDDGDDGDVNYDL